MNAALCKPSAFYPCHGILLLLICCQAGTDNTGVKLIRYNSESLQNSMLRRCRGPGAGTAVGIAVLSAVVAPGTATESLSGLTIVSLGGLAIAGGIVYLAEKLINLGKGVAKVVSEIIIEKFKKAERAAGAKAAHRQWMAWYERQQVALRAGQPFDEPPPGFPSRDKNSG